MTLDCGSQIIKVTWAYYGNGTGCVSSADCGADVLAVVQSKCEDEYSCSFPVNNG